MCCFFYYDNELQTAGQHPPLCLNLTLLIYLLLHIYLCMIEVKCIFNITGCRLPVYYPIVATFLEWASNVLLMFKFSKCYFKSCFIVLSIFLHGNFNAVISLYDLELIHCWTKYSLTFAAH